MKFLVLFLFVGIAVCVADVCVVDDDRCHQTVDAGLCFGYIPKFAFDAAKGCQQFIYGGCGGNDNRFETEAECREICQS